MKVRKIWVIITAVVIGAVALIAQVPTFPTSPTQAIPIPQLPAPSGSFGVGRAAYDWIDPARADGVSHDANARRELMVYVWYPARKTSDVASGIYLPGAKQINADPDARRLMEEEFESNWPLVVSGAITSHALENTDVAKRPRQFPVVIFSHGAGGSSFEYTGLFEDLVSHGYVIVAVEHTYLATAVAFPKRPDRHIPPKHVCWRRYTPGTSCTAACLGKGTYGDHRRRPSFRARPDYATKRCSRRTFNFRRTIGP